MAEGLILKSGSTGDLDQITAAASDIRKGKIGVNADGDAITGTIEERGNVTKSLDCGGSYTLDAGIYTGGTITANSLASQTKGDATKAQILSGKIAWVNGSKLTGTLTLVAATNFKAVQYGNGTVQLTWTRPTSGSYWSGMLVVYRTDKYPNSATDGTQAYLGSNASAIVSVGNGKRYFTAYSYLTTSYVDDNGKTQSGRIYSGAQTQYVNVSEIKDKKPFTSSTTYSIPSYVRSIDIFCVGGGGGHDQANDSDGIYRNAFGGCGGGYTKTVNGVAVSPGDKLVINVGAGGQGNTKGEKSYGVRGGTSSVTLNGKTLCSAEGGYGNGSNSPSGGKGGNGGSGGGARGNDYGWDFYSRNGGLGTLRGGQGGTNGSNGYYRDTKENYVDTYGDGGTGQGTSTKDWFGTVYAGGGGGGCSSSAGAGGAGGGGAGGQGGGNGGTSGTNGFGGGAGGGSSSSSGYFPAANGGSGFVYIRWGY